MEATTENKVGYKKTKLGWIPEDWEIQTLKDVCTFKNGKGHEGIIIENGNYILVNSKFVSTEGEIFKTIDQCLSPLSIGEIVIVMSDVPNGKAIAKCFYIDCDDKYSLNQRIGGINALEQVDSKFLFYRLNRNKYYLRFDDGVNQTNLRKDEVLACPIPLPPLPEQQKIATILSTWDKAIDKLSDLITEKEALKKGLMQQLLTGKKRFPGFKDEWKEVKLGDVIEICSSKRVLQQDWKSEGIPFYRTREVISLANGEKFRTPIFISLDLFAELKEKYGVPKVGDILATGVGTIGQTYVVKANDKFYFKDGNVLWFKMNSKIDSVFLHQQFKTRYIRKQLSDNASITTVATFTIDGARKTRIKLPSIEEQHRIASVLSASDKEIETLNKELNALKEQKRGLMQKLLTGEVRVKID
jgi:type I restriction enzyme S subunit